MKRFVAILMLLAASATAQAVMYKWTDDKGKVHYGDTLPAEYANRGSSQLNQAGQVVRKTDAALTPEQIQARDEAEAKSKKDKAEALERQRRDKALLATYTDVREINLALERNLGQIDVQIKSNELRIKSVQGRLETYKKQEGILAQKKKPMPADLINDMKKADDEISHLKTNIGTLEKDKDTMRTRYAGDETRFRELKGLTPVSAISTTK